MMPKMTVIHRFSERQARRARKAHPSSSLRCASQRVWALVPRVCRPRGRGVGAGPRRGSAPGRGAGSLLGVPAGAHSGGRAMEALAELLAALPALATALALLLAWLLLRRRPAASSDPARAAPEPAPPTAARAPSAPPGPAATENAAAPREPGEPAEPAEEQAAAEKQVRPGPSAPPHPARSLRRRGPRGARNRAPGLGTGGPRRTEPAAGGKGGRPANSHPPESVSGDEPVGAVLSAGFLLPRPRSARLHSRDARPTPDPSRPRCPNPRASGLFKEHEVLMGKRDAWRGRKDGAFPSEASASRGQRG